MVSPEQFERASELFLRVRAHPVADRRRLIDAGCGSDPVVRAAALRLLAGDDSNGDFLREPLSLAALAGFSNERDFLHEGAASGAALTPTRVGRYAVVRTLGSGGMGVVYEARQDQPDRTVAVKVLRLGLVSDADSRRFRREAEFLGRLQHPGIAPIFEAGITDVQYPGGAKVELPFFAMQFVAGESLIEFARRRTLTLRERLELFIRVGDAVAHAHQKGVVHCDLKPANILVENDGQPKVLDFGVALLLEPEAHARTLVTDIGRIFGTLPYMAPEQLSGEAAAIDVRTDVYALGVVLYELLRGELPFDVRGRTLPQALAVVQAGARRLGAVDRALAGDIETIAETALAVEPGRRYQSVAALVEDVRRFLSDEPILARPGTVAYHTRKFVRRHRALVAGGVFAAISLGVAAVVGIVAAIQTRQAAREAIAARDESDALGDFLVKMLTSVNPDEHGHDVRVREVLDVAAQTVGARCAGQPLLEARVRDTIGQAYRALGNLVAAAPQLERAYALRRENLGEDAALTLESALALAANQIGVGELDAAAPLVEHVIRERERQLGADAEETLRAASARASLQLRQRRHQEAEDTYRDVIERATRVLGPDHELTLGMRAELAELYQHTRRYADAEGIQKEIIAVMQARFGEGSLRAVAPTVRLAETYIETGRLADAEPLLTAALETHRRKLGDENHLTLSVMYDLANVYQRQNRLAEAAQLLVQLEQAARKVIGEAHRNVATTRAALGDLMLRLGRLDESEQWLRAALDILQKSSAADPTTATTLECLGRLQHTQADFAAAVETFSRAIEIRQECRRSGADPSSDARARCGRGGALIELGRLDEAEADLRAAFEAIKLDPRRGEVYQLSLGRLIDCLTRAGKIDEARSLEKLRPAPAE